METACTQPRNAGADWLLSDQQNERALSLVKSRNTWKTINDILSKAKIHKKSPTVILENGVTHTDKQNIANKFNNFFTNIVQTRARDIKYDCTKNYKYYVNKHINTVSTAFQSTL